MGDERHKRSPASGDEEEDVTPAFRKKARAIMAANKLTNKAHGRTPRHHDYLIDDDVQLAIAVIGNKEGKTQIGNILGPVRSTTPPRNLIDRSRFVGAIRRALKMDEPVLVPVDPSRAPLVRWIAGLPDDVFLKYELTYLNEQRKQRKDSR